MTSGVKAQSAKQAGQPWSRAGNMVLEHKRMQFEHIRATYPNAALQN